MAKALGSATSSVLRARHTLWRSAGSGTMTAAVCRPAMLNALVGARHVTLTRAHVSDAAANGTYAKPGSVRSQWISSETTVTRWRSASSPMRASVSRSQILPTGLCGLHRTMRVVWGSASLRSRSSKSMRYAPSASPEAPGS